MCIFYCDYSLKSFLLYVHAFIAYNNLRLRYDEKCAVHTQKKKREKSPAMIDILCLSFIKKKIKRFKFLFHEIFSIFHHYHEYKSHCYFFGFLLLLWSKDDVCRGLLAINFFWKMKIKKKCFGFL